MRILLVEASATIGSRIARELSDAGDRVDWVGTAHEADLKFGNANGGYHVIVLDSVLPDKSGVQVLRELRKAGNGTPVLMLGSGNSSGDHIEFLDEGADDFITRPLGLAELRARVRALARRDRNPPQPVLVTSALRLDPDSGCVHRDGKEVRLTKREYALLHALIVRPGTVISRCQLEEHVYSSPDAVQSNAIEFLIHTLRGKIGRDQIRNTRGGGWHVPP